MSPKITADHLGRGAAIYVRQSTPGQMINHMESRRRQYALADAARTAGFVDVMIIDEDLGRSGSGLESRPGFQKLVAAVCAGTVGAVYCIEASRLARNGRDWHHLIDLCALAGALVVDPDGVYDPRLLNDRLLLGLKGTMSEYELSLLRQRGIEARDGKARRGELRFTLPPGYCWNEAGRIEIDPDERVAGAIRMLFSKFRELGSARQVFLWARATELSLPVVRRNLHATPRGWAGPNLLATLLFETFGQHQPLNRQAERFAREGVPLSLSTLADQVGTAAAVLKPLHDLIAAHVMAAGRLHGDDTPVPVLAKGKTDTGRLWVYVRDDRPFAGQAPPAALFHYSRDRKGEHPERHLAGFTGWLQADAFAGYNRLYEPDRRPGPIGDVLCWAHARRGFFKLADIAANTKRGKDAPPISPLALEAVRRIDAIFDLERALNGKPAAERLAARQEHGIALVAALEDWMRTERARLSRHAPVAKAMDYMLTRWDGFTRFLGDGRLCLTTDDVENLQLGIGPMRSVQSTDRMLARRRMPKPGSRPQPRVSAGPRSGRLDAGGVIRQAPMVAPSRLPPSARMRVRRVRHTPPRVAGFP